MSRIFRAPQSFVPPPPVANRTGVPIAPPNPLATVLVQAPGPRPGTAAAPAATPPKRAPVAQLPSKIRRLVTTGAAARAAREEKIAKMLPEQRERFLAREKARDEALTQMNNHIIYQRHHTKVK
jgi:hypothetical protein